MCVYSHFCVHLCACTVISVYLCTCLVISVFTDVRVHSCACIVIFFYTHVHVHVCVNMCELKAGSGVIKYESSLLYTRRDTTSFQLKINLRRLFRFIKNYLASISNYTMLILNYPFNSHIFTSCCYYLLIIQLSILCKSFKWRWQKDGRNMF